MISERPRRIYSTAWRSASHSFVHSFILETQHLHVLGTCAKCWRYKSKYAFKELSLCTRPLLNAVQNKTIKNVLFLLHHGTKSAWLNARMTHTVRGQQCCAFRPWQTPNIALSQFKTSRKRKTLRNTFFIQDICVLNSLAISQWPWLASFYYEGEGI